MPQSLGRLVGISTSSVLVDASLVVGGTPAAASSVSVGEAVEAKTVAVQVFVVVDDIFVVAGAMVVNAFTLQENANTSARVV
jgi:hypothetical protein